jgi:hypothetical protein
MLSVFQPIRDRLLRVVGIDPCGPEPTDKVQAAFYRMVGRYDAPMFALHAPASPQTWEVNAVLDENEEETARIPLKFPSTAIITGMYASVLFETLELNPAANPSLDMITCLMDVNDATLKLTGQQQLGAQSGKGFVTLAALTTLVPRLNMIMLSGGNPEIAFTFRSKFATAGTNGFGESVKIDLALFVTPIGF